MPEGKAPSRAVLVFSGLFTQLIGSACLVLGLASIPVMHDLHRPFSHVLAWIGASLAALLFGGLTYRSRPIAIGLAALVNAGFGYELPRKDSALGALAQLLPAGDVQGVADLGSAVAIGMFVVAALCLVAIPFAVRYRRWEATDEGIRASRVMMAVEAPSPGAPRHTQVVRTSALQGSSKLWVFGAIGAMVLGTGIGFAVVSLAGKKAPTSTSTSTSTSTASATGSGSAKPPPGDAGVAVAVAVKVEVEVKDAGLEVDAAAPPPVPDSPANLIAAVHDALTRGDAAALGSLLAADVLAIGPDAADAVDGRDAAVAMLLHGPATLETAHTTIGQAGKVAWITEELALTPAAGAVRRVVTSTIATPDAANHWTIVAVTWAVPVPNDTAFKLARDNRLPVPSPVADRTAGADELTEAARTAFGSREGFADARSKRADAFNYGSAPGERMVGGAGIQRAFARMTTVQMSLHDGLVAVPLGAAAGYTEANVDFIAPDTDGAAVTQTFRVLATWLREDGSWHIVHSQFSNAKPK